MSKALGRGAFVAALAAAWGCSGEDPKQGSEPTGTVTWCEVNQVLQAKCQSCHVGEGLNGAPFPLVTFEDTQVLSTSTGKRRWERMRIMVEGDFMPPDDPRVVPPPEKLTGGEKALLVTWFDEGAQAVGGTACP